MTRKFKFVGDEPVDLPTLGLVGVRPEQVVDVDDRAAEGMANSASWERVTTNTTKNKGS